MKTLLLSAILTLPIFANAATQTITFSTNTVKRTGDTMSGKLTAPDISLTYGLSAATSSFTGGITASSANLTNSLIVGGTTYIKASAEAIITNATVTGTVNVDWGVTSISSYTLTGSPTFTFSGASTGQTMTFFLTQGGSGSYTVTWPTMRWSGGTAPTLTTTVGKMDIITIFYNGNQYFGFTSGLNY